MLSRVFGAVFLIALLNLIVPNSFSQTSPLSNSDWSNSNDATVGTQDFVILNSGDKIFGKILREYQVADYDQVVFESGGSKRTFLPADLKGFRLDDGRLFLTKTLPGSSSAEFVQILLSGKMNLDYRKDRYFISDGDRYEELRAYYVEGQRKEKKTNRYVKAYLATLKDFLKGNCGNELNTQIEKTLFEEDSFLRLFVKYHECEQVPYELYVSNIPSLKVSPTIAFGITNFNLNPQSQKIGRVDALENNLGYRAQAGIRIHDLRKFPRFSFDLRAGYSSFSSTIQSRFDGGNAIYTGTEQFTETSLFFPVSINYSIYKKGRMDIYLGLIGSFWKNDLETKFAIIDENILGSGAVFLYERSIVQVNGLLFTPGLKIGANLGVLDKYKLFVELEGMYQKGYYQIPMLTNTSIQNRTQFSFQLGFEF